MLGDRAAAGESPNSEIPPADIQYDRGGFSRNGVPASSGSVRSLCWLMRQAISASRGSSGVQSPRSRMPNSQMGANATTMRTAQPYADVPDRGAGIDNSNASSKRRLYRMRSG